MPVLNEDATPPDWYGILKSTREVYDQPYRALGHDIPEPYILYYWLPRIAIAVTEEENARAIRKREEERVAREQAEARRMGRGSRGRPRKVI